MNVTSLKSYLKKNGHNFMTFSGIFSFILSLWLITSFKNKYDRKYTEILKEITAMENRVVPLKIDVKAKAEELEINERIKRSDNESLEEKVSDKEKTAQRILSEGAIYVRWGRTTCPGSGIEKVYSGIAAGSWHGHQGAATNHQCLPTIPGWGRFTDKAGSAFIYGMEYNEAFTNVVNLTYATGKTLINQNVPCAVCRSKKKTTSLMTPGKNECITGWSFEYSGYLMAGHHASNAGTSYLCVDEAPEVRVAGYRDEDGSLLYRVVNLTDRQIFLYPQKVTLNQISVQVEMHGRK